jgi:hypothetical protein
LPKSLQKKLKYYRPYVAAAATEVWSRFVTLEYRAFGGVRERERERAGSKCFHICSLCQFTFFCCLLSCLNSLTLCICSIRWSSAFCGCFWYDKRTCFCSGLVDLR